MDWILLGIEPTKDKKAITSAYRQKLRQTNPEDKPEEFKALRTAYEQALIYADQEDSESVRDESPVGLWMEDVEALYQDYAARIEPKNWAELLKWDVCVGIDTRPVAEEALLRFLMEHYMLPRSVWEELDRVFGFSQRVEELYETWPRDFIDHAVLAGIRMDQPLTFDLYIPGKNGADCDTYRNLYYQANRMPLKEIGPILEQMDALSEHHPYGEAMRNRYLLVTGHESEGREGFRKLAEEYPDDAVLATAWAELCLDEGNIPEAKAIADHILELYPRYIHAKVVVAKALAAQEQYHEAKDYAYDIIQSSTENPGLMEHMNEQLMQWNEKLILQREARYEECPEDSDNAIELAWCYAQNERVEEAAVLANEIDPECPEQFDYHNLMGKLAHNGKNYAEALEHFRVVEEVIRNLPDDGTDKTRKRLARLPEMIQIQGNCLMQLDRPDEAKVKFQQALEIAPDEPEVLLTMGKILFKAGEYEACVEMFRRLIRIEPGAWVAELLMAMCLYRMHQDREAFEAVNRAMMIQSNDLSLYVLKMQILIRNGIYDGAYEILDYLKENNAPEDITTDFIRAELTELEKKDVAGALKQYKVIQEKVEAGTDLILAPELYHHLAIITGNQLNLHEESNRNTVLELVDKGLSHNAQDQDLLDYKAWVLKQAGLLDEAISMYRAMVEKNPYSVAALRGLADLYYDNLNRYAGEALTYYEMLLQTQKTAELYFYAATCKRHMGDLEGARRYYLKELEMDPEDIDGFRGLAFLCEQQGNYDESLSLLDQALAIMVEYDRQYDWMVEHKAKVLRRLGRFEEALSFAAEAANRHHFTGSLQLQFDICCQFGLWDRAKQVLDQWKRVNRNDPDLMAATGRFWLLNNKPFKAAIAMGPAKHKLPYEQIQDFRLQLNDLERNHQRQIQIWTRRVQENPQDDHALTSLAHAYWHVGDRQAAMGAAGKALKLLDEILTRNLTDEPLYRSRRCLVLAILGRTEEATAELTNTRRLPLCDFCEYGSCKDADIYEAAIQEILGNRNQAKRLYTAGRTNWPDDLDFIAAEIRLKKKGRK